MANTTKSRLSAQEKRKRTLAKKRRAREKEYRADLAQLKKVGAYIPKSTELTHYRKTVINKRKAEYGEFLDKDKFFFIPVKPELRGKVMPIAKEMSMVKTRTGIFYEKHGSRRATVRRSKSHPDEFEIHFSGKVKHGINRGKKIQYSVPIAKLDKMILEKDRFRRMAESFGPLRKNERLSFKVIDGMHQHTYHDIERVIQELERYQKNAAAKLAFFRHVIIVKTTVQEWKEELRNRPGARRRRDKRRPWGK